jgi:uncharacterized protein YjbI with pentapeptide repeats
LGLACGEGIPVYSDELEADDLSGRDFSYGALEGVDLAGKVLIGTTFHAAQLEGANLSGADLRDANLTLADLRDADLSHADLTGAALDHARLLGTKFDGAVLDEKWQRVLEVLTGAGGSVKDYHGYDLSRVNFEQVDLTEANLDYANLQGATLSLATLDGASLFHVDLLNALVAAAQYQDIRMLQCARLPDGRIVDDSSAPCEWDLLDLMKP